MAKVAVDTLESSDARHEARRAIQVMLFPGVPSLIIDTMQFPQTFGEGDIHNFNQQFIAILEELRRDVQKKGLDLTGYDHRYLKRLRDIGRAAFNQVLPPAAREWIIELEQQEQKRGLGLTFKTPPTSSLFWEMLYAGKPFEVESNQFWGFRYPMGRTYWQIEAPDRVHLQMGIFSAVHDKLSSSRQEVEQLVHHMVQISQQLGSELTWRVLDQAIPLESLSTENVIELFHSDQFRYGIVHFACHCENPENVGAMQACLSFTACEKEIGVFLEDLLTWQDYGFVHRPFVFLNACESATPGHLLQAINFPTGILNFGAGGAIATACAIPDNFASAFASEFYRRLLGKPLSNLPANIGETLLETRLHFLREFNNPLGLAYSLYAVSNQQLRLMD